MEPFIRTGMFLAGRSASSQSFARLVPLFINPGWSSPHVFAPEVFGATEDYCMDVTLSSFEGPGVNVRLNDTSTNDELEIVLFGSLKRASQVVVEGSESASHSMAVCSGNTIRHVFELRPPSGEQCFVRAAFSEQTIRVHDFATRMADLLEGLRMIMYGPPILKCADPPSGDDLNHEYVVGPVISDDNHDKYPKDQLYDVDGVRQKSWRMYQLVRESDILMFRGVLRFDHIHGSETICRFLADRVDIVAN
ncbi:hypothetical protein BJ165DRAFT_1409776 [Panaeolus papilionaceus]|nr:hypothetical protein BJ165DRAFT_1409776 [Panaeolus papilionaceus]